MNRPKFTSVFSSHCGPAQWSGALFFFCLTISAWSLPYSPSQIEVPAFPPGTANIGYDRGGVVWGDYDNDGDLDILVSGRDSAGARQIRIFQNGGGTTFTQVNVSPAAAGLLDSSVAFGDMDGDGDLDVLATGTDSAGTRRIRIYRNDGANVFTLLPDVDALAAGANRSDNAFGDYDNDGDLDILFCGADGGGNRLRVYKNLGNGSFDPTQIELANGVDRGDVAWGDYDNDGDLDIVYSGRTGGGAGSGIFRLYRNDGNAVFTSFNVFGAGTGLSLGDVKWGDFDADGDLDILVSGTDQAGAFQTRAYRNGGAPAYTFTQVEIPGAGAGFNNSALAWGDVNNDGYLDAVMAGSNGNLEIRVSTYNAGTGAFTAPTSNVESAVNLGVQNGGLALGDFDGDTDLDILVSGASTGGRQLRIYRSSASLAGLNAAPTAPTTLAGRFGFSTTGVSVASFTWNAGGDGALPVNSLYYDIQVSTLATFTRYAVPGMYNASPQMGGPLRPTNIYGGATSIGTMLKSTQPWSTNSAHPGLLTDTTYYFRIRTIDAGLRPSAVSATQTLWTGVAPATSTLGIAAGALGGEVLLSWNAAGDDLIKGTLNGNYRIQYSTVNTVAWSTTTTPTSAYTVTRATTGVTPGLAVSTSVFVPFDGTWYFVLWTQDDVGQYSNISNTVSLSPVIISRSVSLSSLTYNFGIQTVGTSSTSATSIVVTNDGNSLNTYTLSAATTTVGSPWTIGTALPTTADVVVVSGAFHALRPLGLFGPEDIITTSNKTASSTDFSIDGSQTGVAVSPVSSPTRNLWLKLDMPISSSTDTLQSVTVTLTAGP